MISAVEQMITALALVVQMVPFGTNVGLVRMIWAMVNGSFLISRGALQGALAASGFARVELSPSWAALCNGSWESEGLLSRWPVYATSQPGWRERRYAGYRVKRVDITAFWRPRLTGKVSKHYHALARKALPAIVFGVMICAGEIKGKRVLLLQSIVRGVGDQSEPAFRQELWQAVVKTAQADEISVFDAGPTRSSGLCCGWSSIVRLAAMSVRSIKAKGHVRTLVSGSAPWHGSA